MNSVRTVLYCQACCAEGVLDTLRPHFWPKCHGRDMVGRDEALTPHERHALGLEDGDRATPIKGPTCFTVRAAEKAFRAIKEREENNNLLILLREEGWTENCPREKGWNFVHPDFPGVTVWYSGGRIWTEA